jgi:hypothetical protein
MKEWTEFHIGMVYYSGLLISIISGIAVVLYLRPVKSVLDKIVNKAVNLWKSSFKTSIILAGLLGAMSVSFKDCSGKYDYLINSPHNSITKGLEQISASCKYLALILGLWLIVFILLRMSTIKKNV